MTFARNSNIDSVEIRMLDTFFFALSLSFTGWFVLSARQFIFGSTRFILSLNLNSNIWVNLYNNSIVKWKQIYLLKSRTKMKRNKIECAKWFKTNVIASQFNNKHNFIVLFLVRPNFVVFLSVFVGFRVSKKWTKKNCSTFLPLFNCNQCQRDGKSSLCYLFGMNFISYQNHDHNAAAMFRFASTIVPSNCCSIVTVHFRFACNYEFDGRRNEINDTPWRGKE